MPTKLYLHSAANDLSGTFPGGEQSARTPSWTATGGATLRKMDTAIGAAQASLAGTTLANTAAQSGLLGMWVSPPLSGAQTVGGGVMVLNVADQESNAAANFWANSLNVYVWRPSTGALVGTVRDATGSLGGTEGGTGETVTHITGITSSAVSASDGDVVVCELWGHHTQSMATAYTATVYFDGTTENTTENASVSNHASYLELAETLTFQQAITGTASITQANNTVSSTGTVDIAGTASISQADNTSAATGTVAIVGTASVTQAGDSLSATAALNIVGTASITQSGDTLTASGTTGGEAQPEQVTSSGGRHFYLPPIRKKKKQTTEERPVALDAPMATPEYIRLLPELASAIEREIALNAEISRMDAEIAALMRLEQEQDDELAFLLLMTA